jgi:nickel-dependent lactate racemase
MGTTWILNVSLDKYKAITGIFCGDLDIAHATGCEFVKRCSMVPVQQPFEIVITTNSGFPLDLNLYQSVKGMSAAAQVVRPGGAIVIATECRDGIPDHGMYGHMLREAGDPRSLLDRILQPGFAVQDQWTAQIQAQVLLKASVYVKSEYLSDRQIEDALLRPAHSLEETVSELVGRFGTKARICVIPEGPMTIPFLEG